MQAPHLRFAIALLGAILARPVSAQNCGWSRVEHRVSYDASSIWNTNVYRGIVYAASAAQIGGALWQGAESRFDKTMWQGIDSEIITQVAATAVLIEILPRGFAIGFRRQF